MNYSQLTFFNVFQRSINFFSKQNDSNEREEYTNLIVEHLDQLKDPNPSQSPRPNSSYRFQYYVLKFKK